MRIRLCAAAIGLMLVAACVPTFSTGDEDRVAVWDYDMPNDTAYYELGDYEWVKRDWPVTFIFYGAADLAAVYIALDAAGGGDDPNASYMQLPVKDLTEWTRSVSRGSKDRGPWACTVLNYSWRHMRPYSAPFLSMYSSRWSSYVAATTHFDKREHCGNAAFGWSEDAEWVWRHNLWCSGYNVATDSQPLSDPVYGYRDEATKTNYYQQTDGYVTLVEVPAATGRRCANVWTE